jgi:hypothetical protein
LSLCVHAEVGPMTSFRGKLLTHEMAEVCQEMLSTSSNVCPHLHAESHVYLGAMRLFLKYLDCDHLTPLTRTCSLPGWTLPPLVLGTSPHGCPSHGWWQLGRMR